MKLLFRQRIFSWLDSYDIFDENGETVYTVKGQLSFGHKLFIYDRYNEHVGTIKEEILTFLPRFSLYEKDQYIGKITKEFTLFKPSFILDYKDWQIEGNFWEWDYQIVDYSGNIIGLINKEIFHMSDTYSLTIEHDEDAFYVLMIVLAIDAQKCSRNK